jgi:hypothetical protein
MRPDRLARFLTYWGERSITLFPLSKGGEPLRRGTSFAYSVRSPQGAQAALDALLRLPHVTGFAESASPRGTLGVSYKAFAEALRHRKDVPDVLPARNYVPSQRIAL